MPGNLLSSHFRTMFEDTMTPCQQQQAIDTLQDYIHEVQYGTDDQRRDLGIIDDEDEDPEVISRKLSVCLEKCYWQLVMFLKSSKPSLIASAEPYLRYLLASCSLTSDPTHILAVTAQLHLAAALACPPPARQPQPSAPAPLGVLSASTSACSSFHHAYAAHGLPASSPASGATRADEALALFSQAFALYDLVSRSRGSSPSPTNTPGSPADAPRGALGLDLSPRAPPSPRMALDSPRLTGICGRRGRLPAKTELWARASFVRLLCRAAAGEGEEQAEVYLQEANCQLGRMRSYVRENPYALPHEKYEPFLSDLARDFGIALYLPCAAADNEDGPHPSMSRALRFPGALQALAADACPPSSASSASSCSSASSSSSASPQTPHTPLSPAAPFARALHAHGRDETKAMAPVPAFPVLVGGDAKRRSEVGAEVEHREHVEARQ